MAPPVSLRNKGFRLARPSGVRIASCHFDFRFLHPRAIRTALCFEPDLHIGAAGYRQSLAHSKQRCIERDGARRNRVQYVC
jgi:hypothetical protein